MSLKNYIKPKKSEDSIIIVKTEKEENVCSPESANYPITENNVSSSKGSFDFQESFTPTADPRPDLGRDSNAWQMLFAIICNELNDQRLLGIMHGLRCGGTRIAFEGGRHILQPLISPDGWPSEEDYLQMKRDWLIPNAKQVTLALSTLDEITGG